MSSQPLLQSTDVGGHDKAAETAKCAKPWCNLVIGSVSAMVIAMFVMWTVVNVKDNNSNNQKKLISEYSKVELIEKLSSDSGYTASALEDLVTDLPNLIGEYDFLQFSGYLEATNGRQIHYWLVEAETNPESAPVFLWTNGGPGCSGLLGFLSEHGPFWAFPDLTLRKNEYAWNKVVTMLYVEQPYGVGFSEPTDGNDCVVGDSAATEDMDVLLRRFMVKFPKFADNDLYISSESFGGHYMPRLALTILQNNDKLDESEISLNFKGFMVGNPYTDGYENEMGFMGAIFGHGLIKSNNYEKWMDICWGNTEMMDQLPCEELYVVSYLEAYDLDAYALDYSYCPMDTIAGGSYDTSNFADYSQNSRNSDKASYGQRVMQALLEMDADLADTQYEQDAPDDANSPRLTQAYMQHHLVKQKIDKMLTREDLESQLTKLTKNDLIGHKTKLESMSGMMQSEGMPWIACADYFIERYLNLDEVKEALHVDTSIGWAECSNAVFYGWPEKDWNNGMEKTYQTLVKDYDIKIMVFSGDDDSVCAIQGTMYWLERMGWTQDENHSWEKWVVEGQLAGFYTKYLAEDGSTALHFQSVRSAGHMVPQTQPVRALELLKKYVYELE